MCNLYPTMPVIFVYLRVVSGNHLRYPATMELLLNFGSRPETTAPQPGVDSKEKIET